MPLLPATNVKLCPFSTPRKWQAILASILLENLLKVFEFDAAFAPDVEQTERDLVLGVGFSQQVLKVAPICDCDPACFPAVGDLEENGILLSFDLVLRVEWSAQVSRF